MVEGQASQAPHIFRFVKVSSRVFTEGVGFDCELLKEWIVLGEKLLKLAVPDVVIQVCLELPDVFGLWNLLKAYMLLGLQIITINVDYLYEGWFLGSSEIIQLLNYAAHSRFEEATVGVRYYE